MNEAKKFKRVWNHDLSDAGAVALLSLIFILYSLIILSFNSLAFFYIIILIYTGFLTWFLKQEWKFETYWVEIYEKKQR